MTIFHTLLIVCSSMCYFTACDAAVTRM